MTEYKTREEWLEAAVAIIVPEWVEKHTGEPVPPAYVVCGWPSKSGTSRTRRRIGECWDSECSADGRCAIFISPMLKAEGPMGALATLVHELLHAQLGVKVGHKGPFKKACAKVGLKGKPTSTEAGEELLAFLETVQQRLGAYPHAVLTPRPKDTPQKTYMLKMTCRDCGFVARATAKWIDEVGCPACACGAGRLLTEDDPELVVRKQAKAAPPVEPITHQDIVDLQREVPNGLEPVVDDSDHTEHVHDPAEQHLKAVKDDGQTYSDPEEDARARAMVDEDDDKMHLCIVCAEVACATFKDGTGTLWYCGEHLPRRSNG